MTFAACSQRFLFFLRQILLHAFFFYGIFHQVEIVHLPETLVFGFLLDVWYSSSVESYLDLRRIVCRVNLNVLLNKFVKRRG